jgi:hypothetical protein
LINRAVNELPDNLNNQFENTEKIRIPIIFLKKANLLSLNSIKVREIGQTPYASNYSGFFMIAFPPSIANNANGSIRNQHQVNDTGIKSFGGLFSHLLYGFIADRTLSLHRITKKSETPGNQ